MTNLPIFKDKNMKRSVNERWGHIEKLLSCTNCFEIVKTPYLSCNKGHMYCEPCTRKLRRCKSCKGATPPLIQDRNHLIDEIRNSLKFPCQWDGCTYTSTILEVAEHEVTCPHQHIFCLLCKEAEVYSKATLLDHAINDHKNLTVLRERKACNMTIPKRPRGGFFKKLYILCDLTIAICFDYVEPSIAEVYVQIFKDGKFTYKLDDREYCQVGWKSIKVKTMEVHSKHKVKFDFT